MIGIVRAAPGPFAEEHIELVQLFAEQAAVAIANARLLEAVDRQRTELSRFVSPQIAELVSSDDGRKLLNGHRAYITVLFCDLRGFTAFAETAEPEELLDVLRDYHTAIGELIPRYGGTLEHVAGDGLMVFFNDPVPLDGHELQAIRLALAAQERLADLGVDWRKRGTDLGLGIGVSAGYATLGRIGFEGRYDYGALGSVTNLASRHSTGAKGGPNPDQPARARGGRGRDRGRARRRAPAKGLCATGHGLQGEAAAHDVTAPRRKRKRVSFPARRRAMLARCSTSTATAAATAKTSTGHGSPSTAEATGNDSAAAIDATEA